MKAEYDWSLLWKMLKEDKEKALASVETDKSAKENDITPIIGVEKGNVK